MFFRLHGSTQKSKPMEYTPAVLLSLKRHDRIQQKISATELRFPKFSKTKSEFGPADWEILENTFKQSSFIRIEKAYSIESYSTDPQ